MLNTTIDCPYTQAHIRNWLNCLYEYIKNNNDCDVEDAFYIVSHRDYQFMNSQWWLHATHFLMQRTLSIFDTSKLDEIVNTIKCGFQEISRAYELEPRRTFEKLHIPEDIETDESMTHFDQSPSLTPLYNDLAASPANTSNAPDETIAPTPNLHI